MSEQQLHGVSEKKTSNVIIIYNSLISWSIFVTFVTLET